jgi:hypothetical protein
MMQARDMFGGEDADGQARVIRSWLEAKGVVSLPLLPLAAEELDKVSLLALQDKDVNDF